MMSITYPLNSTNIKPLKGLSVRMINLVQIRSLGIVLINDRKDHAFDKALPEVHPNTAF